MEGQEAFNSSGLVTRSPQQTSVPIPSSCPNCEEPDLPNIVECGYCQRKYHIGCGKPTVGKRFICSQCNVKIKSKSNASDKQSLGSVTRSRSKGLPNTPPSKENVPLTEQQAIDLSIALGLETMTIPNSQPVRQGIVSDKIVDQSKPGGSSAPPKEDQHYGRPPSKRGSSISNKSQVFLKLQEEEKAVIERQFNERERLLKEKFDAEMRLLARK